MFILPFLPPQSPQPYLCSLVSAKPHSLAADSPPPSSRTPSPSLQRRKREPLSASSRQRRYVQGRLAHARDPPRPDRPLRRRLQACRLRDAVRQVLEDPKTRLDLMTERCVSHAIVLYGQSKMVDHAVRTFKQYDELGVRRTVRALNSLFFAGILAKEYKAEFGDLQPFDPWVLVSRKFGGSQKDVQGPGL